MARSAIPTLSGFRKSLKGTPMYGEASAIYNAALRNGVNPAFVAGLAHAESSGGAAGYARGTHNPYGWGVHKGLKYRSWAEATDAMTKGLSGGLYKGAGLTTLDKWVKRYTPASDGNDEGQHVRNVISYGSRSGGDPRVMFINGKAPVGNPMDGVDIPGVDDGGDDTEPGMPGASPGEMGQASMEQSVLGAVAGRRPGESLSKTVVQGVISGEMARKAAESYWASQGQAAGGGGSDSDTSSTPGASGGGGGGGTAYGSGGPSQAPLNVSGMAYPLGKRGSHIGSPYGGTHTLGNWQSDNAIDLGVPVGTPVYAVEGGQVGPNFGSLGSSSSRMAGLRMTVTGKRGWYYAHLSKFAKGIKPGARVRKGQLIGYSGSANGVGHLHLGVSSGNPTALVKKG